MFQISKVKYLSSYRSNLPKILNLDLYDQRELCKCFKWRWHQIEDDLKWKTTSYIKSEISQQLLVGSSPNFKLRLIWPKQTLQIYQMKTTSNGRLPQILKVKYLSIYWLNLTQILNFGLYDQSKLYKCFKWRWPQLEDDLNCKTTSYGRLPQISKVEYLSKYWSDLPKILYLNVYDQSKV